jgi:hypothetical protein
MKRFKDLEFKPHPNGEGIISRLNFDNGFLLSVIAGGIAYSTPREDNTDPDFFSTFEVAVFNPNGDFTREFFPEDHNDDVMGWQDREEINILISKIQSRK